MLASKTKNPQAFLRWAQDEKPVLLNAPLRLVHTAKMDMMSRLKPNRAARKILWT